MRRNSLSRCYRCGRRGGSRHRRCDGIISSFVAALLLLHHYHCNDIVIVLSLHAFSLSPITFPNPITSLAVAKYSRNSNNDLHKNIIFHNKLNNHHTLEYTQRIITHTSLQHHRLRQTILHYTSSSASEFPSQEHYQEEENKEYNNFQRRAFQQANRIGAVPKDRQAMMMRNNNNVDRMRNSNSLDDEEDEWESYLNMDIDSVDENEGGVEEPPTLSMSTSSAKQDDVPIKSRAKQTQIDTRVNEEAERGLERSVVPKSSQRKTNESIKDEGSVNDFRNQFLTMNTAKNEGDVPYEVSTTPTKKQSRQRITTEQIQQIKSSISLVDVIETYNLPHFTRTSNSYTSTSTAKACCPFHDDNNPSMSIDDSRGLYKCFACGAGGDVYNFIREYDYLERQKIGKEKMGYMQAVEYVVREFGDADDIRDWNFSSNGGGDGTYEGMSEETKEKIRVREKKKERIRQANTAAAAFYTRCLVTLPTAGKARTHLRSRSISPESIRTFAIGYAPDCYYGDEKVVAVVSGRNRKDNWGKGSLVEYLADSGFTPDEIVEAGLAVRTKQMRQMKDVDENQATTDKSKKGEADEEDEEDVNHDYSGLMDRFRSRLIIPIMDESGQHVIGLGGRHLESAADTSSSDDDDDDVREEENQKFTPAKYINSPDSLVFTKKNVMFNSYKAKLALNEYSKEKRSSVEGSNSYDAPPAVVIVEGYFDAIALSNVGIQNVVASMGTALPLEQLKIAAEMGNVPGGRIILCMDSDAAGINSVERLCSSNILSKVPELNRNELYVASLIGGDVKDPSDFIDFAGGGDAAKTRFQEEILENALPWDEWYVARLISKHEADAKDESDGGFSVICDEVSTFLATYTNPADRTRRVHKIAEKLVGLITKEDDTERSASSLNMLRVQLEADILNMASRKAGVREAMERRIEQTDGVSGDATSAKLQRLSSGDIDTNDDERKMSTKNALARRQPRLVDNTQKGTTTTSRPNQATTRSRTRSFRATRKPRRRQLPERHLVPHFNGIQLKHQTDRDWLGMSDSKINTGYLGQTPTPVDEKDRLRAETPIFEDIYRPSRKKVDVVYFNSNSYLGEQYLSPEAQRAGYSLGSGDRPAPGESIVEFMEDKLFQSDPDQLILQAEARLLHALSKFPEARRSMRTVYSTSTFGPSQLRWTSSEREWLFLCLTGSQEINPPLPDELLDGGAPSQLHFYLANREDCPTGAFNRDIIESKSAQEVASGDIIDTSDESSSDSNEHTDYAPSEDEPNNTSNNSPVVEVIRNEEDELDSFLEDTSQVESDSDTPAPNGLLDDYFLKTDMFPSLTNNTIAKETRAELTVQETVASLLRATAMKRFSLAKSKLAKVVNEMDRREDSNDDKDGDNKVAMDNEFSEVSSDDLQELFLKIGNEVVDSQQSLYDAERSTDRVNAHLLDYSVSTGVQYKLSQAELERLDNMMDDFIDSLPEDTHRPSKPGSDEDYVFGMDDDDANIDPMFGGTNPDMYVVRGNDLPNGESKWD